MDFFKNTCINNVLQRDEDFVMGPYILVCDKVRGGLKMINIQAFVKSMKITWVKRLLYDDSTLTLLFGKNT